MDAGIATVVAAALSSIATVAVALIASRTKAPGALVSSAATAAARPAAQEKRIRRFLRSLGWVFVTLLYLVMALYVLFSLAFLAFDGDSIWLSLAFVLGVGAVLLSLAVWSTRRLLESAHRISN